MLSRGRYFIEFFLFSFVTPTLSLFPLPCSVSFSLSHTYRQTQNCFFNQIHHTRTKSNAKCFPVSKQIQFNFLVFQNFVQTALMIFFGANVVPSNSSIKKNGTKNVTISDKTRAFSKSKYKEKRNKMSAFYYKSPQCSYKNAKRENLKR